ncbi:unnamed protein product [Rotaria sp. Silwood1]|nr:unnamed protein product [Rotaria sp. Silwood1]CAF0948337.1 unnamed protein product [Rotaria sp. Silwood1]
MGLSMINAIEEFDEDNNEQVDMRVDVDSGSVNCGIVGTRKCKFHSFSNNVTLANKMELTGKSVITMSDKRIPFHLRNINNPPPHLNEQQQQQTWIGTAKKTKKNHQLRQQYSPFVVPTSMYEASGSDPNYSTLSTATRNKMIHYAIYDCFATTYFICPVLQYWPFQQVTNINIFELFQALPPSSQANNNIWKTNVNQQWTTSIIGDDIEFISDDDNQSSIVLSTGNDDLCINNYNVVDDDKDYEQQHLPVKRRSCRQRRTIEARKRQNRKRTNVFRLRRYHYFIIRRI